MKVVDVCKKSCCWSPFDVCARGKKCSCHLQEINQKSIWDRQRAVLEQLRAESREQDIKEKQRRPISVQPV